MLSPSRCSYFVHYEGFKIGLPDDIFDRAAVLQWINFANHNLTPILTSKIGNSKITEIIVSSNSNEKFFKLLKYLDDTLEDRTFLVHERFSLADLAVFTALIPLYRIDVGLKSTKTFFVHITRWFLTVFNHPCVKNCVSL